MFGFGLVDFLGYIYIYMDGFGLYGRKVYKGFAQRRACTADWLDEILPGFLVSIGGFWVDT